ncbi:MAG: Y-family DNA polymerase [Candidatus Cryptobacteroides sp.]|nr:Y-family DNA polymerase [Candidatus Cryptobacteroides sp.]
MIALADCNSFFASVERALHPGLKGKPVCVLSSNDGNIVALTTEAKALGLRRGDPYFKVKDLMEKNGVAVFSGNLMLYAAMSKRVQSIMRRTVAHTECYSIDEQFLYLDGYEKHFDLVEMMRGMVNQIALWTDIPVSVGIAGTKTLAKIASKFAKQYKGYEGVCLIDTDAKRRKALSMFDLADVWGIGPRTFAKLNFLGVTTPLQLADKPGEWVRRHFHKPGYQTWLELNGHPCIDTSDILQRQTITTSRSFGKMISTKEDLKASMASFAASCCSTLRGQDSAAGCVSVFACSNRFREDLPQYWNIATEKLSVPSADTLEITAAAMELVERIYRPGILFKKSGVILSNIVPGCCHHILFDPVEKREARIELSRTMDKLNQRYGLNALSLAITGRPDASWKVRKDFPTPNYLTDIDQIMTVQL